MKLVLSLLILAAPVALYAFVIRPRLKARFTDLYSDIDGFWARVWARTYAFRSFIAFAGAAVVAALPEILRALAGVDLSFLPQPWPLIVGTGASVLMALIRALSTTPNEESPA